MPLRGENVGTAFVRIIGDGSGLDADIRRAFNDAEPSVRAAGQDHGRTYGDEFDKQVRKSFKGNFEKTQREIFEDLNDNLTKSLARLELSDRFFKSAKWKEFRKRLVDEGGAAGAEFGKRLEERFRDSGALERLAGSMDNLGPELRRAQKDLLDDMHADALRLNKEFDKRRDAQRRADEDRIKASLNRIRAMTDDYIAKDLKARQDQDRELQTHWQKLTDMAEAYAEHEQRLGKEYEHVRHEVALLVKGESKLVDSKKDLLKTVNGLRTGYRSLGKADDDFLEDLLLMERRIRFAQPRVDRFDRSLARLADRMGAATGRGARNDFINLIGATTRGMFNLLRLIPKTIGLISKIRNTFMEGFEAAGGGITGAFKGLVSLAAPLAVGIGAIGAAFLALIVIIGPLVALMSTLLGIVVALASSLAFALVGALGAVAGALLPVAAGAAVAAIAFAGLDKAQKKVLKNDMKPVVSAFRDLAKIAADGVFANANEQGERLGRVMRGFEDLFRRVGVAISDVADGWLDMMEGPGFKRFRDEFSVSLPGMVRRLGRIFGQTIGGFGGILLGLEPTIQRFLGWLDRTTKRFSDWANSAKGQTEIQDFFDRAIESLESVGGFLESAWNLLVQIMDSGKDSGDSMFDKMADALDRISKWLEENPDAIEDWFNDAERLFIRLGELITGISELLDALDEKWSRMTGFAIVRFYAAGFRFWGRAIQFVEEAIGDLISAARRVGRAIGNAFSATISAARTAGSLVRAFFSNQLSRMRGFAATQITRIVGFFASLPGRAAGAMASLVGRAVSFFQTIAQRAAGQVGRIVAFFAGLPGRIAGALAGLAGRVLNFFNGIPGRVGAIIDDIVSEFAGLAGRILNAIGEIDIGSLIRVPNPGGGIPFVPNMATGGILTHARIIRAGEDGPEAIVPLKRDLGRVDPAVRMLSAFAQGKIPGMASGGIAGVGKTIDVGGITVVSPSADPRAVAQETVNRLVALGY